MTNTLNRRGPSGHHVTVSWEGEPAKSEVAGVRFAGGSYGRGFQVHPLGAHDFAMEHVSPAKRTERVLVGRREVKISQAADGNSTTATLIGRHHELMTVFTGPAPDSRLVAEIFGVLDIDDAKEGMRVVPQRATLLGVMNEHLVLVSDDFVSLDIPGPAHAHQRVPGRRGGKSRHGEVWKAQLPSRRGNRAADYSYVVGTRKGVVEVVAGDPSAISDSALLNLVDSVDVAWRP